MQINGQLPPFHGLTARESNLEQSVSQDWATQADALKSDEPAQQGQSIREAFDEFVGQTFFAELIKSYRSTQQPSEYFHGGRAEQIFQGQLDQVLTEALSERTAHTIADPMFDLFMAKRF